MEASTNLHSHRHTHQKLTSINQPTRCKIFSADSDYYPLIVDYFFIMAWLRLMAFILYANKCENIYCASTEAMSDDNHFRGRKEMRVNLFRN